MRDGRHDFDFLHGTWRIDHRWLTKRLDGCQDWATCSTQMRCRPILGGHGNLDEGEFPEQGYHAIALRLYDEGERTWTIHWITSRSTTIDPGVTGTFGDDGIGTFLGEDTVQGTPVLVRFVWSRITAASAQWDQAFSTDGGKTWETNWIMELTRT